jgi:hypothetical protein
MREELHPKFVRCAPANGTVLAMVLAISTAVAHDPSASLSRTFRRINRD